MYRVDACSVPLGDTYVIKYFTIGFRLGGHYDPQKLEAILKSTLHQLFPEVDFTLEVSKDPKQNLYAVHYYSVSEDQIRTALEAIERDRIEAIRLKEVMDAITD